MGKVKMCGCCFTILGFIISVPLVIIIGLMLLGEYSGPIPIMIPLNLPGLLMVLGIVALPFVAITCVFKIIGSIVGKLFLPKCIKPADKASDFPLVASLIKQGWKIGDEPSES